MIYPTPNAHIALDGTVLEITRYPLTISAAGVSPRTIDIVQPFKDGPSRTYRMTMTLDATGGITSTSGWVKQ